MNLIPKFRKIAHRIYYFKASKRRDDFALRCNDVTGYIDLKEKPAKFSVRIRLWFHLSLCQACQNHQNLTEVLTTGVRKIANLPPQNFDQDLAHLNEELLKKFSSEK